MKTFKKAVLAICCLVMAAGVAWAVDYSKLSTEDLSQMRGTLSNASQADWNAFHTEWQKRLDKMTPEQRQQYTGPGRGMGGVGMGMGRGKGRGMGRGPGCCPGWAAPAGTTNQGTGRGN